MSWIEIDGKMHSFYAHDRSHPEWPKIEEKLNEMSRKLREVFIDCRSHSFFQYGHKFETDVVVDDVPEEEKEQLLCYHSEKIAIAYGLLKTADRETFTVFNNLWACIDCHNATKLLALIYNRKIVVRDANRFHHFESGQCSCGDHY